MAKGLRSKRKMRLRALRRDQLEGYLDERQAPVLQNLARDMSKDKVQVANSPTPAADAADAPESSRRTSARRGRDTEMRNAEDKPKPPSKPKSKASDKRWKQLLPEPKATDTATMDVEQTSTADATQDENSMDVDMTAVAKKVKESTKRLKHRSRTRGPGVIMKAVTSTDELMKVGGIMKAKMRKKKAKKPWKGSRRKK